MAEQELAEEGAGKEWVGAGMADRVEGMGMVDNMVVDAGYNEVGKEPEVRMDEPDGVGMDKPREVGMHEPGEVGMDERGTQVGEMEVGDWVHIAAVAVDTAAAGLQHADADSSPS